ncbi:hypothetical protein [Yinghuangia seranimata]|uniref:hypothetical protein n=1 Tax=Yinghuangia seranimata TaxID=408067 RepID=UPI00248C0BA4|nr:hypothetical protein [Yinghuangia seranimata]MDI2131482.1 hypothetical protein [Yinghuangia seranimata]
MADPYIATQWLRVEMVAAIPDVPPMRSDARELTDPPEPYGTRGVGDPVRPEHPTGT